MELLLRVWHWFRSTMLKLHNSYSNNVEEFQPDLHTPVVELTTREQQNAAEETATRV